MDPTEKLYIKEWDEPADFEEPPEPVVSVALPPAPVVVVHKVPREAEEYVESLLATCKSGVSVGLPELQKLKGLLQG